MKKIYVDKNDSAAAVVEKVAEAGDKEVILYIPRFTKLATSISHFRAMKREFEAAEIAVEIESVDDDVLEMAKSAGIASGNPFFRKNRRSVSDIVLPSETPLSHKGHSHTKEKHKSKKHHAVPIEEEGEDVPVHAHKAHKNTGPRFPRFGFPRVGRPSGGGFKKKAVAGIAVAVFAGALYLAVAVLPRAEITVVMEKINWDFNGALLASTSVEQGSFTEGQARIPAALLEKTKNMTITTPASGEQNVERKATGTITIYNAFSSEPQPIVNHTRFQSPDGKIFRITKALTIPGAKIIDNKIVPAGIEADVVADGAGEEYNISPVRFRVPGFQGTPRYEGFYAESSASMTGGFIGRIKVATDADVEKAKADIAEALESALRSELRLTAPSEITLIDDSLRFTLGKVESEGDADQSGNFRTSGSASVKAIGFRETDLFSALEFKLVEEVRAEILQKGGTFSAEEVDLVLKDGYSITYGKPTLDFNQNEMTVPMEMQSVWSRYLEVDEFKASVAGKTQRALASDEPLAPGVKSVSVSLWPMWVRSIPGNPEKISVDVQ